MLLSKNILPTLVALVYVGKVASRPQITVTLPFVPNDGPDDLDDFNDDDHVASGVIVGTGSAGETTYILTMTVDDDNNNRPITATLAADASGATVVATYDEDEDEDDDDDDDDDNNNDDDDDGSRSIGCGIQSDNAVCTYARGTIIGSSTSTTFLTTRTAPADRVTLIASTGSAPTQTQASNTDTSTASGAGSTASGTGAADGAAQTSGVQQFAARIITSALSAVVAAYAMA
ncbi:hypothetical protein ACEPAF_6055 [Sanghuangporus sanghuang]